MKTHTISIAVLAAVALVSCTQSNDISERNKNTILKAHEELLTKGNLAYADEAFSGDYSFPGVEQKGSELIKQYVTDLKRAFPDLQYKLDHIVAEGNQVSWTRTVTGTHSADFMGYKATGKKVTWLETNVTRFTDDGKIAEEWGVTDFDVNASNSSSIEGVYEYLAPMKGQSSNRNGRFVHLYALSDGTGQTTGEAGTYTLDGNKVICTRTYSTNARSVGTSFTWQPKSWSGDTLTYEIVNDKGEATAGGRAVRVSR